MVIRRKLTTNNNQLIQHPVHAWERDAGSWETVRSWCDGSKDLLSYFFFQAGVTTRDRVYKISLAANRTPPSPPPPQPATVSGRTARTPLYTTVVRAFTHGVMGRWIDPSLWTHYVISRSSQCSTTGVAKVVICAILPAGWCI